MPCGKFDLENPYNPYKWKSSTVIKILSQQEYCSDVINFKTYSKSFKLKRRLVTSEENRNTDVSAFVKALQKYTHVRKLTERILNELIERIEVFHAEKTENGERRQRIRIVYNYLGSIEIPDLPDIADCHIQFQARKGVEIKYSQVEQAV